MRFSIDDDAKIAQQLQPKLIAINLKEFKNLCFFDFGIAQKAIFEITDDVKKGDLILIKYQEQIELVRLSDAFLREINTNKTIQLIGRLYAVATEL